MDWLTDLRMEIYIPNFSEQGLTNLASLELLNIYDLAEIGIFNEHQGPLMDAIQVFSARTREWTDTALYQNAAGEIFSVNYCRDLVSSHLLPSPNDILAAFDACNRSLLFTLWECFLPLEARNPGHPIHGLTSSLEFYLQVYIVVRSLLQEDSFEIASTMEEFRRYIQERASKLPLANTKAFVAYAGICLVPEPRNHPSYKFLFEFSWRSALRERLRVFLEAIRSQNLSPRATPRLPRNFQNSIRETANCPAEISSGVGLRPPKLCSKSDKSSTLLPEVCKETNQSLPPGSTHVPQDQTADLPTHPVMTDVEDSPLPKDPFCASHQYHSLDSYDAALLSPDNTYYPADKNRSPTAATILGMPAMQPANPRRPSRDPPPPPQPSAIPFSIPLDSLPSSRLVEENMIFPPDPR